MIHNQVHVEQGERIPQFEHNCQGLLPLCAAACCREWEVSLSREEYDSGIYQAEILVARTEDICEVQNAHRDANGYQLKKGMDGACIYLDDDCRCRIYEIRPKVCRNFTCQGDGLVTVFPWQDLIQDGASH